jgi:hypothetical protein
MTGTDLKHLLAYLDINPHQAGELLGVHPTSVYRWLAAKNLLIHPDPSVARMLAHLKRRQRDPDMTRLKETLQVHGGLAAVALVISDLVPSWAR